MFAHNFAPPSTNEKQFLSGATVNVKATRNANVRGGRACSRLLSSAFLTPLCLSLIQRLKGSESSPLRNFHHKAHCTALQPSFLPALSNTVETAYKVPICPTGNLLYMWPYFISNLIISVNISFLLTPPSYPHGKSLFTSHFELNNWCKWSKEPKQMQTKLPFPVI